MSRFRSYGGGREAARAKARRIGRHMNEHVRTVDARDVGISEEAAVALAPVFDDEPTVHVRHYLGPRAKRTSCDLEGFSPNTLGATSTADAVTCEACRAKITRRRRAS